MVERWETIRRHPAYEVSDLGRIRRAQGGRGAVVGRILRAPLDSERYPHLHLGGTNRTERVHILVAEAFLGRIPKCGQVHHRNEDRTDCRAANLEILPCRLAHAEKHRRVRFDRRRHGERNPLVACACGCRQRLRRYARDGRPRRFLSGHYARVQNRQQVAA